MKVLISADMEGSTGVTAVKDVTPGEAAYERFRRLLTADVNAAVEGALAGGATQVWVTEAHDRMRNLLIQELHPGAEVIRGDHKPHSMMFGFDLCDLIFFIGYHARAGEPGVLAHTFRGAFVAVEINGVPCSEARINAALAGERGRPVGLVTGDDVICAEAEQAFPGVKTAAVKYAIDNFCARCLTPDVTASRIYEAARAALEDAAPRPFTIPAPLTVRIHLREPAQAGALAVLPLVTREGPTTIAFQSANMTDVCALLQSLGTVASGVRP
jgi:D-amino peptidase